MDETEFQELMRYQNFLSRQVMHEARTDRKIKFLQLVNALSGNGKRKIQTAVLVHEAETHGFSEADAYATIEELEREGMLGEASRGYLKRL